MIYYNLCQTLLTARSVHWSGWFVISFNSFDSFNQLPTVMLPIFVGISSKTDAYNLDSISLPTLNRLHRHEVHVIINLSKGVLILY